MVTWAKLPDSCHCCTCHAELVSASPCSAKLRKLGETQYNDYIFVVSSQKAETEPARVRLQPVSEGISVDNKTEITNGISAGDMIVVKGQSLLNDGSAINIVSVSE